MSVSKRKAAKRTAQRSVKKTARKAAQGSTKKNIQKAIQKSPQKYARKSAPEDTRGNVQKNIRDIRENTQRTPGERPGPNRTYKARLFAMIFSDKENLLELYNAVNGTHYEDAQLLEINTLENAIYMSMHNDLSFVIDSRLSLYEHQSTSNPNLPLRFLFYIADLYSGMMRGANLYGSKQIQLDTPHFLIFYNGQEEMPERMTLQLSDLFKIPEEKPQLELTATVWNINIGNNKRLMEASRTLRDYAEYTSRVREYVQKMPLEKAVERAVDECIRDGVLADFLRKNRAEAIKMSIYEYDEEDHKRILLEEGREEGKIEGRIEGKIQGKAESVLELLEELGPVPADLRGQIMLERNLDTLRRLHILAARAKDLDEFVRLSGEPDQH